MSCIDHLYRETKMLQVEVHLNLLYAATMPGYRECLSPHHQDGSSTKGNEGDNVHQTLSNRVTTASRKDTLQALHTSFVNTAIDNMEDNRVLNKTIDLHPSMTRKPYYWDDKGQPYHISVPYIVNYWIPTKSDWSKVILQVVQTVGMEPHDVHHLFDFTAHTNDLSPCEIMGQVIWELSFLDPDNLD